MKGVFCYEATMLVAVYVLIIVLVFSGSCFAVLFGL